MCAVMAVPQAITGGASTLRQKVLCRKAPGFVPNVKLLIRHDGGHLVATSGTLPGNHKSSKKYNRCKAYYSSLNYYPLTKMSCIRKQHEYQSSGMGAAAFMVPDRQLRDNTDEIQDGPPLEVTFTQPRHHQQQPYPRPNSNDFYMSSGPEFRPKTNFLPEHVIISSGHRENLPPPRPYYGQFPGRNQSASTPNRHPFGGNGFLTTTTATNPHLGASSHSGFPRAAVVPTG